MKRTFVIAAAVAMGLAGMALLLRKLQPDAPDADKEVSLPPAAALRATGRGADRSIDDYRYRTAAAETQEVDRFWAQGAAAPAKGRRHPDIIAGEYVLSFFDEKDKAAFLRLLAARGGTLLGQMGFLHTVRVRVRSPEDFEALLKEGPTPVRHSENFYTRSPEPWGRGKRDPESGYLAFLGKSLPWLGIDPNSASRGKGVTVAVLDSGVQSHPALRSAAVEAIDETGAEPASAADAAHGTAVASLLAGQSADVTGVVPDSRILSVRVIGNDGVGDTFTLAQGIVDAADRGAQVINICLGSQGDSFILQEAVAYARQKGAVVVASTGNDAVDGVLFPAAYDGVVAVSAVDAAGRHAYFANRGAEVDLSAPGIAVNAAWTNGTVAAFSGTSAAVPFVSGAIALLLSENPGMSAEEAVRLLAQYADDAGDPGRDDEYGAGILNVKRAEERNTRGIYDMAAGDLVVHEPARASDDMTVVLSVQNRGTESIYHVVLTVEAEGIASRMSYFNVQVGQTLSHQLQINRARLEQMGSVVISYRARIDGKQDADPSNNGRRVTLSARRSQKILF